MIKAIVQIAIFSIGIYAVLRFLRGTRGGGIMRGLVILLVVLAFGLRELISAAELNHLSQVYEGFLTLSATGLIIIFQPELRRALYRLGENPLLQRFLHGESSVIDEVTKAVVRLSRSRTGALIAFEREISIGAYIESGVAIDAAVKADLLDTIFYPGSPLHDGAVVIRDDRIAAASCLFPLTENPSISRRLGTRHRAAIGLTEESDALTVIVSEETGKISIGLRGELYQDLGEDALREMLTQNTLVSKDAASK
ncbi:MAG: diadenylate cyclase CdaA [Planctomycetota bacterium]